MTARWAASLIPLAVVLGCGPTDKNQDGIVDRVYAPTQVDLAAPATPTGSISGQLLGVNQMPLVGVTVTANLEAGAAPLTTTTDASGSWSFAGIPGRSRVSLT